MRKSLLAGIALACALAFPAMAQEKAVGLVTEDTVVVISASGGLIRQQKADTTCSLRKDDNVVWVVNVAGVEPASVEVKKFIPTTLEKGKKLLKKLPKVVAAPKETIDRFGKTCGVHRHVIVPKAVMDKWVAAEKAEQAKRDAEKAVKKSLLPQKKS